MSRMGTERIRLQECGEYEMGKQDAAQSIRRATFKMTPHQRRAYELGLSDYEWEQRTRDLP